MVLVQNCIKFFNYGFVGKSILNSFERIKVKNIEIKLNTFECCTSSFSFNFNLFVNETEGSGMSGRARMRNKLLQTFHSCQFLCKKIKGLKNKGTKKVNIILWKALSFIHFCLKLTF